MQPATRSLAAGAGAAGASSAARGAGAGAAGLVAVVGDTLVYTIVVTNGGATDATGVRLGDTLSATTPIESAVATQGSCTLASANTLSCALGTVPAGTTATVTVTAHALASGIATSTATVVANEPTTNAAGVQATTTVTVTPQPQYGRTVDLIPVAGTVSYRLPTSKAFLPLQSIVNVPARTEVNALHGTAAVVSAHNPANTPQTGKFAGGRFVVSYRRPIVGTRTAKHRLFVTQLRLSAPLRCTRRELQRGNRPARTRSLWGNGKGSFRTSGRYASATVRGTVWFTRDTCRSTTVHVRRGRVDVYDFLRRKHVIVRTGHSYTAIRP